MPTTINYMPMDKEIQALVYTRYSSHQVMQFMPAMIDTRNLVRWKCEKGTTYSPCWKKSSVIC